MWNMWPSPPNKHQKHIFNYYDTDKQISESKFLAIITLDNF